MDRLHLHSVIRYICTGFVCFALMAVASTGLFGRLHAQETNGDSDYLKIKLTPQTDIREVTKTHLGNPDLWPIILRFNGIEDLIEFSQQTEILLPANLVKVSAEALSSSLLAIQDANNAGAQIFAPRLIEDAIKFRNQAMMEDKDGDYDESILLSTESITNADTAEKKSSGERNQEAEARLSDRHGTVQGQKSEELSWSDRQVDAVLNEQEKLRTLSQSTAQVIFRDASRLRLNPNSQAVIQRMRTDLLQRREEAKISLVEGNFYALLGAESKRSRLEVELPNADAEIDSGNFWVSSDKDAAKFSNFDTRTMEISAQGKTLMLGRNEAVIVRNGEAPKTKIEVLDRVELLIPEDETVVFGDRVSLTWNAAPSESGYWLEVATDPRFDRLISSQFGISQTEIENMAIEPGKYYWRVAALDSFGLPGQMSIVRSFEVQNDATPPFLRIIEPRNNAIIRKASVKITGESEPGASIRIDGKIFPVGADGGFTVEYPAAAGDNDLLVTAIDRAGNETERRVSFSIVEDVREDIQYSDSLVRDESGAFLSAGRDFSLAGTVIAGARISVIDASDGLRSETFANETGAFLVNIPIALKREAFRLNVTTRSGYDYSEAIEVTILEGRPKIRLAEPLPRIVSDPVLAITVETDQISDILINGEQAAEAGAPARFEVPLKQGLNTINIVATNRLGAVSIDKRTVVLDTMEPEITSQEIDVRELDNSSQISIRIGAKDASGLAKTSKYRVFAQGKTYDGVLRFNRARKRYQGTGEFPKLPAGEAWKFEFQIADNAGNVSKLEYVQ